jgi:NAD(P)-dependent dehydrogenase (short-subunit alcohol dehydrogenase family)
MISSIAGRMAMMPLNAWYHASKFGLEALSDVLRMEVAGFGVKVSIVEPGFFKTGIETKAHDRAEARLAGGPSPYATAYQRARQGLEVIERVAPSPDLVARTIVTAVESRRPLKRYLVGADALAVAAGQFLPRGVIDAASRVASGLVGRPDTLL